MPFTALQQPAFADAPVKPRAVRSEPTRSPKINKGHITRIRGQRVRVHPERERRIRVAELAGDPPNACARFKDDVASPATPGVNLARGRLVRWPARLNAVPIEPPGASESCVRPPVNRRGSYGSAHHCLSLLGSWPVSGQGTQARRLRGTE